MNVFRTILIYSCFFLCVLSSNNVYADIPCDPIDPDCEIENPDEEIPLDSGVGLLIGAATLYTIKKIRDRKELNNNTSELG